MNYERLFRVKEDPVVALRLGGLALPDRYGYLLVLPAEISFINGKRKVKFEYGFGLTYVHFFERERPYDDVVIDVERTWFPVFRLVARYQPAGKPFFMRLAFTPNFVGDSETGPAPFLPWGGLSFCYSFGKK